MRKNNQFVPSVLVASSIMISAAVMTMSPQAFAQAQRSAGKAHPYSQSFERKASDLFMDGQSVSSRKTDAYIQRLKQKRTEIASILSAKERQGGERDASKIAKKISEEGSIIALGLAIESLESLKTTSSRAQQLELITNALDLEGAIRIQGELSMITSLRAETGNVLKTWKVPKTSQASDESTNLFDTRTNTFLTVAQVEALKASGGDLSAYGPGAQSRFWIQPTGSIASVDVNRAALGKNVPMYKEFDGFPQANVFEYDEVKQSSTKPKLDVFIKNAKGKKEKFKLKFGGEVHADPTAAAVMMTLGFPTDITKYARDVKVVLGKTTFAEMKRDWEVYYRRDGKYKIEDYIRETGVDRNGDNFVIFKEASIEAKPKKVERIGGWAFEDNSHDTLREVRGLILINMWLDNSDLKEFENNKVLLSEKDGGGFERKMIVADVGHSFGGLWLEAPDLYSWNMITSARGNSLDFTYRGVHSVSIKNKVTFADGRWATRLIASMTRDQIARAVALGGWPQCIQTALTEKMISRRNDLVKNFGLEGTRLADGRTISLMAINGSRESLEFNNICNESQVNAAHTTEFDLDIPTLMAPIGESASTMLQDLAKLAIQSPSRIVISSKRYKLETRVISEILVNARRDVERNPSPESADDMYIVRDHFEIGARLGVAYGLFKDVVYTRRYSLAYPVRSLADSRRHNGFIVNLLLAKDIKQGNLPAKYVLKTEHYRSHGLGVDIQDPLAPVTADIDAGVSKVMLWRSIYDHRDTSKLVLYRDRANMTEAFLDAGIRAGLLKIPVYKELANWGRAAGKGATFNESELNSAKGKAVWNAVVNGDFEAISSKEQQFLATNEFKSSLKRWNFLLWKGEQERRLDRVEVEADATVRSSLQYRTARDSQYRFVRDNRQSNVSVEVFSDARAPKNYQINVSVMNYDASTTDREMTDGLDFINGLSVTSDRIVNLTPSLGYTTNGKWGATIMKSDTEYSAAAVARIANSTAAQFWAALAGSLGKTPAQLNAMLNAPRESMTGDEFETIAKSKIFLRRLGHAGQQTSEEKKVKEIAEAVRAIVFHNTNGYYDSTILGALNRLAGESRIYSRNVITVPPFAEVNLLEETPVFGEIGKPLANSPQYLVFSPNTPLDLYTMFDSWF